jgi:hypothetical protein
MKLMIKTYCKEKCLGLAQGPVACLCSQDNEPSDSVNSRSFLTSCSRNVPQRRISKLVE